MLFPLALVVPTLDAFTEFRMNLPPALISTRLLMFRESAVVCSLWNVSSVMSVLHNYCNIAKREVRCKIATFSSTLFCDLFCAMYVRHPIAPRNTWLHANLIVRAHSSLFMHAILEAFFASTAPAHVQIIGFCLSRWTLIFLKNVV